MSLVTAGRRTSAQVPALTSLRFLAALVVLLFHFPPPGEGWVIVAGQGHIGVNVFFVLSGFLITARYGEAMARGEIRLSDYFLRRAARILPLYYAVFILSQLVSTGRLSLSPALLPEWTLTQGLFSESVYDLVVPTSWSLTVEECFYALAPLLYIALAAVGRRSPQRPLAARGILLLAITLGLLAAGAAIWTVLDGRGPGFLRTPRDVLLHTLLGRGCDFAAGAFAAEVLASPSTRAARILRRPGPAALATCAGAIVIFAAQWGMHEAGGIDGPRWAQVWAWGLLLAPAAALLIASLAEPANPVGRVLGIAPLVYLGKVSYALYLVQLAPIGRGLLYQFLPRDRGGLVLIPFYAGLIAVSALLYELVEEPARKLVLRAARLERNPPLPASPPRLARLATAAAVAAAIATQVGSWTVAAWAAQLGPVTLAEVQAAGSDPVDVAAIPTAEAFRGRDVLLIGVPRRWREGWSGDLYPPSGLWVFVDGALVPFTRQEPPGGGRAAFYRGPRSEFLALRSAEAARGVVVVRKTFGGRLKVHLSRLSAAPGLVAAIVASFATAFLLTLLALHGPSPHLQASVSAAAAALVAWWLLDLYRAPWAAILVVVECVLLLMVAVRRRGSPLARREAG